MHLVSTDRRVLDGERVCHAIEAIGEPKIVAEWASRFGLLGDPNRLALLIAIHHSGPISVTDIAVATDMNDTTVSHALRLLRAAGTVVAHRDGRIIRYELADTEIGQLLEHVTSLRRAGPPDFPGHG